MEREKREKREKREEREKKREKKREEKKNRFDQHMYKQEKNTFTTISLFSSLSLSKKIK